MNKLRNLVLILSVALFTFSCAKPTDPVPENIAKGEWIVEYAIGGDQENIFPRQSVLHLDINETFLFVKPNGFSDAGTWSATEETLTLNGKDGAENYTIVNLTWEKMHVYRTITGDIEIRYLFRRVQ